MKEETAKKDAEKIDLNYLLSVQGGLESTIKNYSGYESMDTQSGITYKHGDKLRFVLEMEKKFSSIKEVTDLPFVKDIPIGKKENKRSFWTVEPTGDYTVDCEQGSLYGAMTYAYMRANRLGGTSVLGLIVFDMMNSDPKRDRGLIVGFFYFLSTVMKKAGPLGYFMFDYEIAKTFCDVASHNERKRKERNKKPYTWSYPETEGQKVRA